MVLDISQNYFHLEVEPGGDDLTFLCSLIYGLAAWKEKKKRFQSDL